MRLAVVLATILGLWLQLALPVAAAASDQSAGLAAFCGAGHHPDAPGDTPAVHDHQHCLFCHAGAVAALLPPGPQVPHPSARMVAVAIASPPDASPPAVFRAYASRAPPEIG